MKAIKLLEQYRECFNMIGSSPDVAEIDEAIAELKLFEKPIPPVIKQSLITEKVNCAVCDNWYDETLDYCPNCGSDRVFVTTE